MSPNLYQGPLQEEEEVEVVRAHTHEAPVDDEPPATSTQDQSIREEVEHDGERLHGWVMNQLSAYLEQTGGRGHVMGEADRLATRILREGWPLRASAELIMEKRRECALRDDVPDLHRLTTWTLRDLETKFLGEVEDRRARRREFERCEEMMVHHEEWLRDQERDHSEYAALARKIFGVDPGPDSLRAQRGKPVPELEELRDLSDRFLEVPDFGDRVEDDDADTFDEELAP